MDASNAPLAVSSATFHRLADEILSNTEFLMDTNLTERQRERIQRIGELARNVAVLATREPTSHSLSASGAPLPAQNMLENHLLRASSLPGEEATKQPVWRILVVEDNLLNQRLMHRLLTLHGHQVRLASNGAEAIQTLAEEGPFDVVLMDLRMPVLDGWQTTTCIRKQEQETLATKRLPIIAVTALTGEKERQLSREVGMDGFHSKPVQADLLLDEIRKLVVASQQSIPVTTNDNGSQSPSSEPEESPDSIRLDLDRFHKSVDGDWGLMREVTDLYFVQADEQMQRILDGIRLLQIDVVREAAHSLKGASSTFGTQFQVYLLAYQLEQTSQTDNLDQAKLLINELAQALALMQRVMARFFAQNRGME